MALSRLGAALIFCSLLAAPNARGDCVIDGWDLTSTTPPFNAYRTLFPNWTMVPQASFGLFMGDDGEYPACPSGMFTGLTILNYGTATGDAGGDILNVYARFNCGTNTSALFTLGYAGVWTISGQDYPAWTWDGDWTPNQDPCDNCECIIRLNLYTDISACPVAGRTVQLALGFNDVLNPALPGGVYDSCGCAAPWYDSPQATPKVIQYVQKRTDINQVAPGDTLTYTITYGLPGTDPLSSIVIMDTLPAYTHYVGGSAIPAPDIGWTPDLGPPPRLRWTLAGGDPTGGPTREVRFSVSVDWGNEPFDIDSGTEAAPEGAELKNVAQVFFEDTSCLTKSEVNPPAGAVVRRFMFFMIGDNDILFSPIPGTPNDEIIYEMFIKNISTHKTWWNVRLWDTVPPELDVWGPSSGLYDPCIGWTMTPTPCAPANPGKTLSGTDTILYWTVPQLAPLATLTLRWKAKVDDSASAEDVATNIMSIRAFGFHGVDGTGDSLVPRCFVHKAAIALPTTYISYVGWAAGIAENCDGIGINFFPLNKKTNFALYGIEYRTGTGFADFGGVSESIGCLIGDCLTGFPGSSNCSLGSGAIAGGGNAGCGAERTPARYVPTGSWIQDVPEGSCDLNVPANLVYKLVANSPLLWQLLILHEGETDDHMLYAPSSSMNYSGFMHYHWRRNAYEDDVASGDCMSLINTGLDASGEFDPDLPTTVHLFRFDFAASSWEYRNTYEIGALSQVFEAGTTAGEAGPWRILSSDAKLLVSVSWAIMSSFADNSGAFWPNSYTGLTVSEVDKGTLYGLVTPTTADPHNMILGNTGSVPANCRIWRYVPETPGVFPIPQDLGGSTGSWVQVASHTIPAGFGTPGNPKLYHCSFPLSGNDTMTLFKVNVLSGGPIQIWAGEHPTGAQTGHSILSAADGTATGSEYWVHYASGTRGKGWPCEQLGATANSDIWTLNVFAPKANTVVECMSTDGYNSTYTTDGQDQAVSFLRLTNLDTVCESRTYRVRTLGDPAPNVLAQIIACEYGEKAYTAPFLVTGKHYRIIAPSVAFAGQPFWITVVVVDADGTTDTSYTGESSFTCTDSSAVIESIPLGIYTHIWTSGGVGDDNGVRVFVNVILNDIGVQTIVAADTADGSITGLTALTVVATDIKLTKNPPLSVAASGDTVVFEVCWSNYSSGSAFMFVITDRIPEGTTYFPEDLSDSLCSFTAANPASLVPPDEAAYSTDTSVTMPPDSAFITTGGAPPDTARWLRWTIDVVGPNTSGCLCYSVLID